MASETHRSRRFGINARMLGIPCPPQSYAVRVSSLSSLASHAHKYGIPCPQVSNSTVRYPSARTVLVLRQDWDDSYALAETNSPTSPGNYHVPRRHTRDSPQSRGDNPFSHQVHRTQRPTQFSHDS